MHLRRRRIAAFAVAWAYLLGYLLAFAHFVEERHAPCAEHGAQHHIAESTELAVSGVHDGPRLHEGADVDDDHCELIQFFRSSSFTLAEAPTADTPAADHPTRVDSLARTSIERADNARWRYAPKQSPPLIA